MAAVSPSDTPPGTLTFGKGRWIDGWNPEDTAQWEREGRPIAMRNLRSSIYAEFLGFVVWQLWAIIVPLYLQAKPGGAPNIYGFAFDSNQAFWLISLPSLVGATLRFPYTFMVSKLGGRNWTMVSAALLLIPTVAMSVAISNHPTIDAAGNATGGTPFAVMLLIAAFGGFGGGNFASSMANITFFFPQREKGWALGLNAAGGNIGAAVSQFVVPIVVSLTAFSVTGLGDKRIGNVPISGYLWIVFILAAIVFAFTKMNNLTSAKADTSAYAVAFKDPQLWLMSLLYIGTFGSFIGLGGVFPKLITDTFPAYSTIAVGSATVALSFLGPLVGSLARPYGGRLADRVGGAYVTVAAFLVMAAGTAAVWLVLRTAHPNFWIFLGFFLIIFIATGVGNGSMYRMIPTVFAFRAGQKDARTKSAGISVVRKTSAALGIVSAFGAYGGFAVPQLFNLSKNSYGDYIHVLWWFMAGYLVFLVITVVAYVIPYARQHTRV